MLSATPKIQGFHAHVYFNQETVEAAQKLCLDAKSNFPLSVGRMHTKMVGPHTEWSCQLAFAPEVFGQLIPWLALHRHGLVIFVHPISDNELLDHRDRSVWLGAPRPLVLDVLNDGPAAPD